MKLLVILLLSVTAVVSQDRGAFRGVFVARPLTEAQRAQLAFDRQRAYWMTGFGTYYGGPIRIMAIRTEETGPILRLKGSVEIRTDGYTLEADEVALNRETHVIEPRGNVRLTPVLIPLQ